MRNIFLFLLVLWSCQALADESCDIDTCAKSVYPIIKDPNSFLPISDEALKNVCEQFPTTWSDYLVCLKNMTRSCSGLQIQHDNINRAVGDSINTVHKICTNDAFKEGFMAFTHCINEQINEVTFCNEPYQKLIEAMDKGTPKRDICCASIGLKMCLNDRIAPCCSEKGCSEVIMGTVNFPEIWIDKALGLLTSTCKVDRQDCFPKKVEVTSVSSSGYFPSGPRVDFPGEDDEVSQGDADLRRQTPLTSPEHNVDEVPRSTSGGDPDSTQKLPKSIVDAEDLLQKAKNLEEEQIRSFDDFIKNGLGSTDFMSSPSRSGAARPSPGLLLVATLPLLLGSWLAIVARR